MYATRTSNRKYRRDLSILVHEAGNPDLAKQIMAAPFTAMPTLTEAAGLCADDVSTAPMPGQTANYALNSDDKKLAKQIGLAAGSIAAAADAKAATPPSPEENIEKAVEDSNDIAAMSAEDLAVEEETLARRIELLGVQADKADERGRFRLAESIDREIEENEARLERVRGEIHGREAWTDEDEAVHQEHLEGVADPYFVPDRVVADKLPELYERDPNYITGVSDEYLANAHTMFPGDDEKSRELRAAAINELVRRGDVLDDEQKSLALQDKIAERGLSAHNVLPGTDPDDAAQILRLSHEGNFGSLRESLTDPMSDDPEVLTASRDKLQDMSAASRSLAESLELQAADMGRKDKLSGPLGEGDLKAKEVRALAAKLRDEADAFDASADQIGEHASSAGLELPDAVPDAARPERAAQKVHDNNAEVNRADPDEIDAWLDTLAPKGESQYGEMSAADLHLETASAASDDNYTGNVQDLVHENLARTGYVPAALADKALTEMVREQGFSTHHSPDGKVGTSGIIHAAGHPDSGKSLDRLIHTTGQTTGVSEDKLRENWGRLDATISNHDSAEKLLRDQAALMGPDDVMSSLHGDMTRDEVLKRADVLAKESAQCREARKAVAVEYGSRVGSIHTAAEHLHGVRDDREQTNADQRARVEGSRRRVSELDEQEEIRKARQKLTEIDKPAKAETAPADLPDAMEQMLARLDATSGDLPSESKAVRMLQSESLRTTAGDEEAEGLRAEFDRVAGLDRPTRSPKYKEVTEAEKKYARDDLDAARELREAASKLDDDGILVIPNPDYTPDSDADPEGSMSKDHALKAAEKAETLATQRLLSVEKLQDSSQYPENIAMYTDKAAKVFGKQARPSVAGIAEEARKIEPTRYDAEIKKAKTVDEYVAALEEAKKRNKEYSKVGSALRDVSVACGSAGGPEGKEDRAAIRQACDRLLESRGNELWISDQHEKVTKSLDDYNTLTAIQENAPKAFKDARKRVESSSRRELEADAGRDRYRITEPAGGYDRQDPETLEKMFYDSYNGFGESKLSKKIDKAIDAAGRSKSPNVIASEILSKATPKEVEDYADHLWCDFQLNSREAEKELSQAINSDRSELSREEADKTLRNGAAYLLSRRERFEDLQRQARKDPEKLVDLYHLAGEYPSEDLFDLDEPDRVLPPEGMSPLFDLPETKAS